MRRSTAVSTLQATPGVPHVFQGFWSMLDEGATALARAGVFRTRHLEAAGRD